MSKNKDNKHRKKKSPKPPLPHGWVVHVSKTYPDRVYYFNTITGNTTWEFPMAPEGGIGNNAKNEERKTTKKNEVKNDTSQQVIDKSKISVPANEENSLSGPEDYVEEDDHDQPGTSTKGMYRCKNVEESKPSNTNEKFRFKSTCKENSKKHKYANLSTFHQKTEGTTAKPIGTALPMKPIIKHPNETKSVKKINPSVHFNDTSSPRFSSDDNSDQSPVATSQDLNESTLAEKVEDLTESMFPPSPPENSIYDDILENSFEHDSETLNLKSRPFSVSELKKANLERGFIKPSTACIPALLSSTPTNEACNSVEVLHSKIPQVVNKIKNTIPVQNPQSDINNPNSSSSHASMLGKRKHKDLASSVEHTSLPPIPQEKILPFSTLPSTITSNDIIDSDFILWENDPVDNEQLLKPTPAETDTTVPVPSVNTITPLDTIKIPDLKPDADHTSYVPDKYSFSVKSIQQSHLKPSAAVLDEDDESEIVAPKKAKTNNYLGAALDLGQSAASVTKSQLLKPNQSVVSLDSVGMDSNASFNSMGITNKKLENLFRPSTTSSVQSSFTSSHKFLSSGDHWEGQPNPTEDEEDMEWESANFEMPEKLNKEESSDVLYSSYSLSSWHIIVDTNVLLYDIKYIEELRDTQFTEYGFPIIVIPWVALQELDNLKAPPKNKSNIKQENIDKARVAVSFILNNLSTGHPRVKGQSFDEFTQNNYTNCSNNDDKILNFCSSLQKKGCHVTLLTEDKNLRNKAILSRLESCSKAELLRKHPKQSSSHIHESLLMDQTIETSEGPSNVQTSESAQADKIFCETKNILLKVLKQVLVQGMKKTSKTMWQRLVVRKPPWSLDDILYCLRYHWVAIFKFELSSNAQNLVEDLEKSLKAQKGYGYTLSEIKNLVETSLGLCSCIVQNNLQPNLVSQATSELKKLLVACLGGESLQSCSNLQVSSATHCDPLDYSNVHNLDKLGRLENASVTRQNELEEVQKHFTVLWERTNRFCANLAKLMTNTETEKSSSIYTEIEKNISAMLRTVKQFLQLNQKLLNKPVVTADCSEIHELHSILLSESSNFDDETFSEESLSEFYNQRREELKEAHKSFESFVTVINRGIRYLMSKNK